VLYVVLGINYLIFVSVAMPSYSIYFEEWWVIGFCEFYLRFQIFIEQLIQLLIEIVPRIKLENELSVGVLNIVGYYCVRLTPFAIDNVFVSNFY